MQYKNKTHSVINEKSFVTKHLLNKKTRATIRTHARRKEMGMFRWAVANNCVGAGRVIADETVLFSGALEWDGYTYDSLAFIFYKHFDARAQAESD